MIKSWVTKPCCFGVGFCVWYTGAEIFIGPIMIRLMWRDRKVVNDKTN